MPLRTSGLLFLLLLAAVSAAALGLSLPVHFRAVSPVLLEEAAEGTATLADRADDFLTAGQPGPVLVFARVQPELLADPWRSQRLKELRSAQPHYRYSGGPAPYFERFLEGIRLPESDTEVPVLPLVLPREHRSSLLGFLQNSSNSTVRQLLATRDIAGYQHFLPVFSAAGHPLDAAILVTALLEQSNAWQPGIARELNGLSRSADEDPAALAALERIYLAVVTLASRTDWTQLTALLRNIPDRLTLEQLAAATHQEQGAFATLYSAIVLSGDAPGILAYLEQEPDEGWQVIRLALEFGAGALRAMASIEQPLYEPPSLIAALPLHGLQDLVKGFAERNPATALVLKIVALLASGYFLISAWALLLGGFRRKAPTGPKNGGLRQTLYLFGGLIVAGVIGFIAEPRLLEFAPKTAMQLRLDLEQIVPDTNLTSSASSPTVSDMIDQVTLIVLLMFLVLQLAVFTFSLLKLREIKMQDVPAKVKLTLLDNEDSLFDLGLYIGLGGTVSSLILVVMKLLDASLMAAYTSTLFGIIFVALLKIFFLRPLRRRLILEASENEQPAA